MILNDAQDIRDLQKPILLVDEKRGASSETNGSVGLQVHRVLILRKAEVIETGAILYRIEEHFGTVFPAGTEIPHRSNFVILSASEIIQLTQQVASDGR